MLCSWKRVVYTNGMLIFYEIYFTVGFGAASHFELCAMKTRSPFMTVIVYQCNLL